MVETMEKIKKIICLYGGPGSGKSTTCAGLFYNIKLIGLSCEMNREYVKEWCFETRKPRTGDQSYFFAKMARKERIYMDNELDFIITDSPLILTHFYGIKFDKFEQMTNTSLSMLANHHTYCKAKDYKVDHFFINRVKPYSEAGRYQTAEQASALDQEIKDMLYEFNLKFTEVDGDEKCVNKILEILGIK